MKVGFIHGVGNKEELSKKEIELQNILGREIKFFYYPDYLNSFKWQRAFIKPIFFLNGLGLSSETLEDEAGDVAVYLTSPSARGILSREVYHFIKDNEITDLIAHSLGSVISYSALTNFSGLRNDHKVTHFYGLGSPLWLKTMKLCIGNPFSPIEDVKSLFMQGTLDPVAGFGRAPYSNITCYRPTCDHDSLNYMKHLKKVFRHG